MRNGGRGRPLNKIVRRPQAVNHANEIVKQARDLNDRAATFHAQLEDTHANDRFGQLYFKVFLVALITIGVGLLASAAGWSFAMPVIFWVVAGCILVGGVLFMIIFFRNASRIVRSWNQRRRIE